MLLNKRNDARKAGEHLTKEQPNLPVELLDHIFSFLEEEPSSLRSCMEVNEMFFQIAERHLYTIVRLHNQERFSSSVQLTPVQLHKLLTDSPHIASYVRCVRIVIGSVGIFRWLMTRSINDEDIGSVLRMLPKVSEINLTARQHSKTLWQNFHQTFQSSMTRIFKTSFLTNVFISNIDLFPLNLLNDCVSLKSLSLCGTFVFDNPDDNPQSSVDSLKPEPQLDMLYLWCNTSNSLHSIVSWFRSDGSPTLSTLTSLRLCTHRDDDYPHFICILNDCSASLKRLELYLGSEVSTLYDIMNDVVPGTSQPQPFDLSAMKNLEYIKIKATITSSVDFWVASNGEDTQEDFVFTNPLPWIERMLASFSNKESNILQSLVFEISFNMDLHDLRRLHWEPLTTLLSSIRFSALKQIELRASIPINSPVNVVKLIQILQADEHLSRLVRKQFLKIVHSQDR